MASRRLVRTARARVFAAALDGLIGGGLMMACHNRDHVIANCNARLFLHAPHFSRTASLGHDIAGALGGGSGSNGTNS